MFNVIFNQLKRVLKNNSGPQSALERGNITQITVVAKSCKASLSV